MDALAAECRLPFSLGHVCPLHNMHTICNPPLPRDRKCEAVSIYVEQQTILMCSMQYPNSVSLQLQASLSSHA